MDYAKESLRLHSEWRGKLEVTPRAQVDSKEALSLAYTPGVAQPCLEIQKDINKSYELTRRWNTVAVVTDGTAVLGLGDIGPEAGMPVMEGKCVLFKAFGGVDAIPLCVRSKDVDEIVNTIALLAGSFGGINLEDISAPRCFEIERKLKERCDIPVFHDDQHGTAVVVLAALTNALKELEADELVQRIQYNEMPLRVEYSLTEKGRDLLRLQAPHRLTPDGTQPGETDPCYRPAWPRCSTTARWPRDTPCEWRSQCRRCAHPSSRPRKSRAPSRHPGQTRWPWSPRPSPRNRRRSSPAPRRRPRWCKWPQRPRR